MSILEKFQLDGKLALITGCKKGIGFGITKALAEAGADIIGVSRSLGENSDIENAVKKSGRKFFHYQCDFSVRQETHQFLEQLACDNLEPDILISNAGTFRKSELTAHTDKFWDDVIEVNLSSHFILSRELSKSMVKKSYGKIIFTSSIAAFQGFLYLPSYVASKGGVAQITKSLSNELAPKGLNVNAIAPGFIETNMIKNLTTDSKRSQPVIDRIPIKRWGSIDDIGAAAVFLASDAANYISGTILTVDGGYMGY